MYLTEFCFMHNMYGSSSYNQNSLNVMETLRELILVYAIDFRITKSKHSTL